MSVLKKQQKFTKKFLMKNEFISILVTNFNKEKFIKKTLNSIYKQNFKNFEVILFDDCSNDNSLEIIKKFKKVKLIKNKIKYSEHAPINQINGLYNAFKKSRGKIICLLDGDDFFKSNKLSEIHNYFKKNIQTLNVYNKPITSKKKFRFKKKYTTKTIWPTIFPTSCISTRRNFMKNFFDNSKKNEFHNLEIDARITIFSKFFHDEYNILDKKLTIYNHDANGITSNINKFSKKWWLRRSEAFDYMKIILKKKNKKFVVSFDYLITKFLSFMF